jgi:hypothetical protein
MTESMVASASTLREAKVTHKASQKHTRVPQRGFKGFQQVDVVGMTHKMLTQAPAWKKA